MDRRAESVLVWGAGGHGRVVAGLVRSLGLPLAGHVDRDPARRPLLSEADLLAALRGGRLPEGIGAVALGIGDNEARAAGLAELRDHDVPVLVHPTASVSDTAVLGRGTVVLPMAVVHVGCRIAAGGIVNSGAVVEHDCVLGEAVHVAPGAVLSGGVEVGDRAWIGVGATVIQGVRVGAGAMVGAGAVILRDVPDGATVVGNPGRELERVRE